MADRNLLEELAAYVTVLERSAKLTHRAEDRQVYTRHLAAAAQMFRAAQCGDIADLKTLVQAERRAYGWSYLSDAEGAAAEKAFAHLAQAVEASDAP